MAGEKRREKKNPTPPPPIPLYPPQQLNKYAESFAYFADDKQAAIDSGVPTAHAQHYEKTDPAFQSTMAAARAAGYATLKLSVHRALRAGVDKGDKSSIERALKILSKAGIETGFDDAAPKPKKRSIGPPPKSLSPRIAKIYWREINAIQSMQEAGKTLTGEQLKFLKTMKEEEDAKSTPGQIREVVKLSLEQRAQRAKENAFDTLESLMKDSKRDDVRKGAADSLIVLADKLRKPSEGYRIRAADPTGGKIVNITSALKVGS